MIEAVARFGGTVLGTSMPEGRVAYVDGDWLPAGRSGPVPAVVVEIAAVAEPDVHGSLPLLRLAQDVVGVLESRGADIVLVQGIGLIAGTIRRLSSERGIRQATQDSRRPSTVVDVTGDPERIVEATKMVDDLGTVVLAGDPLGRPVDLDCYADVHARGLTVIGVPSPALAATSDGVWDDPHAPAPPEVVHPGRPIPEGRLWYRLEP